MTLLGMVVVAFFIVMFGLVAYWIIMKFFKEGTMQTIALAVCGLVLLIILFAAFLPDVGNYRIFGTH